jgi:chorismate mutase
MSVDEDLEIADAEARLRELESERTAVARELARLRAQRDQPVAGPAREADASSPVSSS